MGRLHCKYNGKEDWYPHPPRRWEIIMMKFYLADYYNVNVGPFYDLTEFKGKMRKIEVKGSRLTFFVPLFVLPLFILKRQQICMLPYLTWFFSLLYLHTSRLLNLSCCCFLCVFSTEWLWRGGSLGHWASTYPTGSLMETWGSVSASSACFWTSTRTYHSR